MSQPVTRPRDAAPLTRGRVHAIHYDLSYILAGGAPVAANPATPTVVCLHDFPGDATVMQPVLSAAGGKPALAFDLLGYGQSARPWPADLSVWGHADVVNEAVRALGIQHAIFVGYGLGGGVAQILATRFAPELTSGLVLIDAFAFQQSYSPDWPLPQMEQRRDPEAPMHTPLDAVITDLRRTIPAGSATPASFPNAALDALVAPYQSELGKEVLFMQIRGLVPYYLNAVESDLATLACPTLIVWGAQDQIAPLTLGQRLQRTIPRSRLAVVPNAGHLIFADAPAAATQPISEFLGGL